MTISSRALARTLAERLGPHLPAGAVVAAEGADVVVTVDGTGASRSGAAAQLGEGDGRSGHEKVVAAVCAVLAHVQRRLAATPTRPWPADAPQALPTPGAVVAGGLLHAWYGDRDAPVITLSAFRVDDGA